MHRTKAILLSRAALLTGFLLFLSLLTFGQTVYVTNTGSKYHSDGCQYLRKSKNAISYDKALKDGYIACSVCKPSQQRHSVLQKEKSHLQKKDSSVQCNAMTKAGNRCSRNTKESNGKCWQHQ
jgi:hypothetical protein